MPLWPIMAIFFAIFLLSLWIGLLSIITVIVLILTMVLVLGAICQEIYLAMNRIEYPPCPLCGTSDSEPLWLKDKLAMVKCRGCGLVMASPRYATFRRFILTQYWGWKDIRDKKRRVGLIGTDNVKVNILPKLQIIKDKGNADAGTTPFDVGTRLIDVGCGLGTFLEASRDAGFNVTGIEPAWFSAMWSRWKFGLDIKPVKLERYHPKEQFDVVVCLHVIEHMPDPLETARHLGKLSKSGGIIMLATPNVGCPKARALGATWEAVGPADHLFLFDKSTLTALVEKAGLKVIEYREEGQDQEEILMICTPSGTTAH
jgi:2-polyprenyl-3-methyl-5-hydroxy-6-metoxy-1,4-benzoquinol methylase